MNYKANIAEWTEPEQPNIKATLNLTKNIELMEATISALRNTIEDKTAIITLLKMDNDRLKSELLTRK